MATVKNLITVTSDTWDEDKTIRELVGALAGQLSSADKGKATGLSVTEVMNRRYGNKKLVAKVTVTVEGAR